MEYTYKEYEILTKKEIGETRIVTISDLNWNQELTKTDIQDLIVRINDTLPKYIFLLGGITSYNNLEEKEFQKHLDYFLQLLSSIGKAYLVFGNLDYKLEESKKNYFVTLDNLLKFYNKEPITTIHNYISLDNNVNIVGFNKIPSTYHDVHEAKKEIQSLIAKINSVIDQDKFNILITHSNINILKLERSILETFDLILTTDHKITPKKRLRSKENQTIQLENSIIENGGIHSKGELDFIKIKHI